MFDKMFELFLFKIHHLLYSIVTFYLLLTKVCSETQLASKKCLKEHNVLSSNIEFMANCKKSGKLDKDEEDPAKHKCFLMRRHCAKECTKGGYYGKCDVAGDIKILLIGGSDNASSSMEFYYPDNPQHNHLVNRSMLQPRMGHMSFLTADQSVLTTGGYIKTKQNKTYLSTSEIFDIVLNKAKLGIRMMEIRGHAGYTLFERVPYICGGRVTIKPKSMFATCIQYQSNGWVYTTKMPNKCSSFPMVEFDGFLYTFGGRCMKHDNDSVTVSSAVRQYSPITNKWKTMQSMKHTRKGAAAATLEGLIYVCGGFEDGQKTSRLSKCESFDHETNSWHSIAEMSYKRSYLNLVAVGGRLFALGGNRNPQTVEMYDLKTRKWANITNLMYEREDFSAILIP